ncbi:hypothetical protein GCM10010149_37560 [Nonomuraea roseoviolacea subsp. roseoviolacea]|uniref:peroxiredoxin family protein n=1 Tax=Nonomuraea roseoviolacea TaxID=103837 RepID=UPI0031CE3E57
MTLHTSLTVAVGLLGLLNLLLMVGVIRRLGAHTAKLTELQHRVNRGAGLRAGGRIDRFEASAVDGTAVSSDSLAEGTVVAFFKPGCGPCEETQPEFVEYARTSSLGRDGVLAVVVGTGDEVREMVAALSPVTRVVVEPLDGPVAAAFSLEGFPTFARIGADRKVSAIGHDAGVLAPEADTALV